ncbi:MAG: PilZ domain-containing protein [Deltaproteobacteria bacterium]|nr:PilZ domain-containing protein [Deltaproteobacteria bacterium]
MNSERRKAERAPANLLVYFGHADANHLGFAQDISSTGVRLRARKAYPAGTKLFLKVEVPGEGMVPARGVVQRARRIRPGLPSNEPSEMGILIIQENPHLKDLVDDLLHTFENNRHGRRTEHEVRVSLANSTGLIAEYTQNIGDGGIFVVSEVPREKGGDDAGVSLFAQPFRHRHGAERSRARHLRRRGDGPRTPSGLRHPLSVVRG